MIHKLIEYLKSNKVDPTSLLTILAIEYPEYFSMYYNKEHSELLKDRNIVTRGINEDGDIVYGTIFSKEKENTSLSSLAAELRKLWQKNVKGRSGNKHDIILSLAKFKMFNDYSEDSILEAAKKYIDSLDDPRYMSKLESFIDKKLLDFLEEPVEKHYDKYS